MFDEKPWLKFYEPHVPAHIDIPQTTMPTALEDTARRYPGHPAMIFKGRTVSYRAFNRAVDRFAAVLQELGVKKGDRVAVHLLNCPQFPIAYYATLRAGGIGQETHRAARPVRSPQSLRPSLRDRHAGR